MKKEEEEEGEEEELEIRKEILKIKVKKRRTMVFSEEERFGRTLGKMRKEERKYNYLESVMSVDGRVKKEGTVP